MTQTDDTPIIFERHFDASVEKVWAAITNLDQMRQWYFDLDDFQPVVDFQFHFTGKGSKGEQYLHLCKVTAAEPLKRIQYTWQYEGFPGQSVLTWELSQDNNGTWLRLTHEGLSSFHASGRDFAKESFNGGWTYLIDTALKEFLEK